MAKPRQSSFRRILVSRLLILSVPVLLTGELVVFKKARHSMLETASQNLQESAILKAQKITDTIGNLKSNLNSASQTIVVRSGNPEQVQAFIDNFLVNHRQQIECIQVLDLQKKQPIASTCGDDPILPIHNGSVEFSNGSVANWGETQSEVVIPPKVVTNSLADDGIPTQNKLQILISAPVFNMDGNLDYVMAIRAQLREKVKQSANLLTSYTVVLREDGKVLSHPFSQFAGTHIKQHPDAMQLRQIIKSAIANSDNHLHLFSDHQQEQLIAGYAAIPSPVSSNPQQKWIIVDAKTLDTALYGLRDIKVILVLLTIGLIGGCVIVSLYLARHVSHPLDELCDYALQIGMTPQTQKKPYNFQIREFNQLARAFDLMTERLNAWAEEIESAWKDAKTSNQLKSRFLASTSHEIRNPLNAIINSIQFVKDDLCDDREEELEYLEIASQAAIHLLDIINDLLDISKIEAGKLSVNLETTDLREIIKETINLQSVNIQAKGLQFNVPQLEEEMTVKVDRGKLKQVLINVIGNANKFTDEGSISLSVVTDCHSENNQEVNRVFIEVTDTGIGIDPSQQQQLFRPFVMVEDTAHSRFKGTGLGLAISKNLIEMMGGTITLFSAGLNQGTTVTITLPLLTNTVPTPNLDVSIESPGVSQPERLLSK